MRLADKLTILRVLLIPIFVATLIYFNLERAYLKYLAIFIFVIAMLTDYFDGLVARLKKEKSDIGKVIDPLADKMLLLVAFLTLYFLRDFTPLKYKMPLWFVLLVVSRDIIILLGVGVLYFLKIDIEIKPSIFGKLTTFFQMLTVLFFLLEIPFFTKFIYKIAAVFTLVSGFEYFSRGIRAINNKSC